MTSGLPQFRAVEILHVGESYSHCRKNNLTLSDIYQTFLSADQKKKVEVIHIAAGGYGVIQMLNTPHWCRTWFIQTKGHQNDRIRDDERARYVLRHVRVVDNMYLSGIEGSQSKSFQLGYS